TCDLGRNLFGEHVVALRRQMLAVRLMRQSPEHAVGDHDYRDAPGLQPALDFRCSIGRTLAAVVAAGLQDDGAGPVWYGPVKALQHAFRGVAVDAGVHDTDVGPLRPQYRLELRGVGLVARDPLAERIAGAEGHDRCGVRRCRCEREYGDGCQCAGETMQEGANCHIWPPICRSLNPTGRISPVAMIWAGRFAKA